MKTHACSKCLEQYPCDGFYKLGLTRQVCKRCIRAGVKTRMDGIKAVDPARHARIRLANSRQQYKKNGRTFLAIGVHRKRARDRGLPDSLTVEQWLHTVGLFGNACAYCKSTEKLEMDHFEPLASVWCPGTVAWNVLPACEKCNYAKLSKRPFAWPGSAHLAAEIWSKLQTFKPVGHVGL